MNTLKQRLADPRTDAVVHSLQRYYASLHTHQTTAPMAAQMLDFDGLNAVIGTPELMALGQDYGRWR